MVCRFVCHPHLDYAGFCDPTSRLHRIFNPLAIWIHVHTCLNVYQFEYPHIFVLVCVLCSHILWNCIENHSCSHTYLLNILDSNVWPKFHMCEETINIVLFCESAHRKVIKSSEVWVLRPYVWWQTWVKLTQLNWATLKSCHKNA